MAEFRFYAELNGFLAPALRERAVAYDAAPHASLKHSIEALGVPHTEVGLVLCNGRACALEHRRLADGDRVSVYPAWRQLRLAPAPDTPPRFIADAHLARLARYLRFAGYDTLLHETGGDAELAALARGEARIVLTRDRQLLMHRDIEQGCYLWSGDPLAQWQDLAHRLRLGLAAGERRGRCMLCNQPLVEVDKQQVLARLPERTAAAFDRFWRCPRCERVYWHGSHWQRLVRELGGTARGVRPAPSAATH
ncbi:MAG: Mut7-C RNAse domain-containing protein [Pseudomonadota bacterium]